MHGHERKSCIIPQKRDGVYIKSAILGAVLNLIVNLILIPRFGSYGAAIATVLAEVVVCVYQFWSVRNEISMFKYLFEALISLCCGGIMFAFLDKYFGVQYGIVRLIVKIVSGALVYLILIGFGLGIEKIIHSVNCHKGK